MELGERLHRRPLVPQLHPRHLQPGVIPRHPPVVPRVIVPSPAGRVIVPSPVVHLQPEVIHRDRWFPRHPPMGGAGRVELGEQSVQLGEPVELGEPVQLGEQSVELGEPAELGEPVELGEQSVEMPAEIPGEIVQVVKKAALVAVVVEMRTMGKSSVEMRQQSLSGVIHRLFRQQPGDRLFPRQELGGAGREESGELWWEWVLREAMKAQ